MSKLVVYTNGGGDSVSDKLKGEDTDNISTITIELVKPDFENLIISTRQG